jgi:hypothetical protein
MKMEDPENNGHQFDLPKKYIKIINIFVKR